MAGVFDFLQNDAQLAGRPFCSRCGIVKFMRESGREFSQRSQAVSLLLDASGLTDPVGHQADQTRGQFRHPVDKFRKLRGWESQDPAVGDGSSIHRELLHPGEGKYASDVAWLARKNYRLTAEFAAPLELAFQNHEHPVRRFALADV